MESRLTEEFDDGRGIDIGKFLEVIRGKWKSTAAVFVFGAASAAVFSITLPNVYRATTLLAPVKNETGVAGGLRSQFGGLAAIAGIDLGANGNKSIEAVATLSSDGFARDFISDQQLLPVLFAEKWDTSDKKWRSGETPPTMGDGVLLFRTKVCNISEDRKTGLVTVKINWTDRELAAQWANLLVERLNERMRLQAIEDSRLSIDYLTRELEKTSVVESRQAIFGLIQSRVNAGMLANVQREYVFKVVDLAVAPDAKRKVAPQRSLFTIGGGVAASTVWLIVVLWRTKRQWWVGK